MLREVQIRALEGASFSYEHRVSNAVRDELLEQLIGEIERLSQEKCIFNKLSSSDFFNFRLQYMVVEEPRLLILCINDVSDNQKHVSMMFKEIVSFLVNETTLHTARDEEIRVRMDAIVAKNRTILAPKIAIVGFAAVGKTTITNLITKKEIPKSHVPTINGDIAYYEIFPDFLVNLWDFAGQDQFSFLWPKFIEGSDVILLVTDSTMTNVSSSSFFLDLARKLVPYASIQIVANKQDVPGALEPSRIGKIMKTRTPVMPFVGTDPSNREELLDVLKAMFKMEDHDPAMLHPIIA